MKIYTKICGITRPEDGLHAAKMGADAIGLVFFSGSKRAVSIAQAHNIIQVLPPFVSVVGLFVNETAEVINDILSHISIDILQFHGDEDRAFCEQFHRPYLKAVRVQTTDDVQAALRNFPTARAILFDAFIEGAYGGTGHTFDWSLLPKQSNTHWILSGGLTPENIVSAIQKTGATAVDISSGLESSAGIKSHEKINAFMQAIQSM